MIWGWQSSSLSFPSSFVKSKTSWVWRTTSSVNAITVFSVAIMFCKYHRSQEKLKGKKNQMVQHWQQSITSKHNSRKGQHLFGILTTCSNSDLSKKACLFHINQSYPGSQRGFLAVTPFKYIINLVLTQALYPPCSIWKSIKKRGRRHQISPINNLKPRRKTNNKLYIRH